ncbi:hypothetical protein AB0B83_08585 [Micromonospora sp. NPDC049060]|uniref:hypothetical protein n=1 Tax=Micromonospora sp. NPDC049060 TaxID=3154828 RepID=UPI0033C5A5CC
MSRRTKKRTISPEAQAAYITARATEVSAVINASATRGAARTTGWFAVGVAFLTGLLAMATVTLQSSPEPANRAVDSGAQQREHDALMLQQNISMALAADCTRYEANDRRVDCINKQVWAAKTLKQAQEEVELVQRTVARLTRGT